MTPAQCRAARALLDWSQSDLSARASVGKATIYKFETDKTEARPAIIAALQHALQNAGVEFVEGGVRLQKL